MSSEEIEILLVEDDPADARLIIHALRHDHLANRIELVHDGEEALDFLFCRKGYQNRSFQHPPRVVLLDLKLPKLDGMEVLAQVKADARTKSIPIVILTSSKEESDRLNGYKLGANSYIQKPVDFEKFRHTVKQLGLYWLVVNEPAPVEVLSPQ